MYSCMDPSTSRQGAGNGEDMSIVDLDKMTVTAEAPTSAPGEQQGVRFLLPAGPRQLNGGTSVTSDTTGSTFSDVYHSKSSTPNKSGKGRSRSHSSSGESKKFPAVSRLLGYLAKRSQQVRIPYQIKRHLTYYRLHFLYILTLTTVGTAILWLSPKGPEGPVKFIDALFVAASASCVCGLNSVKMRTFSVWDEVVILILMILGSHVFTSVLPVLVRRYYFHRYLERYKEDTVKQGADLVSSALQAIDEDEDLDSRVDDQSYHGRMHALQNLEEGVPVKRKRAGESKTWSGETAQIEAQRLALAVSILRAKTKQPPQPTEVYFSDEDATGEDTDGLVDPRRIRTLEYRALQTLSWLVPAYFFGIQLVAMVLLRLTFIQSQRPNQALKREGVSLWFMSAFQAVSGFNNGGFSLLDDSLVSFQEDWPFVTIVGALILVGNTMYAPTMRGIIYVLWRRARPGHRSMYRYLLDHPRKCFTHLFPYTQTLWLVLTVLLINSTELIFFCALDWNSSALQGLPTFYKLWDGLFQSLNTRSSGMTIVFVGLLSKPMLVLYCGMMYIAVYPVYLSRQRTRVDKEIYDDVEMGVFNDLELVDNKLLTQTRRLVARDSAYLFCGVLLVCIFQRKELQQDPHFDVFNVIFECISAYGTVGMSLGYTCTPPEGGTCESPPYSFSGVWRVASKVVVIVLILFGRHRGLPDNIDSAITVPQKDNFRSGRRRSINLRTDIDPMWLLSAGNSLQGPPPSTSRPAFVPGNMTSSPPAGGGDASHPPLNRSNSAPNLKQPNKKDFLVH